MPWNSLIGNWIINLSMLLIHNIIISQSCHPTADSPLPSNWPCQWNNGRIPFMFNFYSMSRSRHRLINLVKTAHDYIEQRSCLVFEEYDPRLAPSLTNITYLFYVFSSALENCCLKFYKKDNGRRMLLITPLCRMPGKIAHVTLHGLGITHNKDDPFMDFNILPVLFPYDCKERDKKLRVLHTETLF